MDLGYGHLKSWSVLHIWRIKGLTVARGTSVLWYAGANQVDDDSDRKTMFSYCSQSLCEFALGVSLVSIGTSRRRNV